ncbi:putative phosphoribomutase [Smittium mucronatum]|uniref:Putative phosphoribomutase n=1 Tax=Smittium mucronatum TaxID=133383 RepID=A0A1R0GNC9_9FUNG|nr:putative phosphoribomutase [Smittium mucronatum]OLY78762.1 putative phosphoribomutase [Smittium mucronatum]
MTSSLSINDLVEKWLSYDKDPVTREQITKLNASGDVDSLEKLLRKPIEFGTAGLRSKMEAGFSRMNCVTVIQASQGLAVYVKKMVPDALKRGVVIGYDHRHNSQTFARLTAAVFLKHGFSVYFLDGLSPTPLVPFSVKKLLASCGVMITASHNPKDDNGYKVYWENGAQIIPPVDGGIAESIKQNQEITVWDLEAYKTDSKIISIRDKLINEYLESAKYLILDRDLNQKVNINYVYTAMHGVGAYFCERILESLSLKPYIPVISQLQPDPDFPTVRFPNPEEKGALDLAKKAADENGSNIVLASDPDADRFAAAEKQEDGSWFVFSGDQLGILLAYYSLILSKSKNLDVSKLAMVNSTVSSKMLRSMAKVEGFRFEDTLTGFKWMSNELIALRDNEGLIPAFAYEEAIGFLLNPDILDKDGITALVSFVQLANFLDHKGMKVKEFLDTLYTKYGYFASDNYYYICNDVPKINKIFDKIRYGDSTSDISDQKRSNFLMESSGRRLKYPLNLGGSPITYIRDLTIGFEMSDFDKVSAASSNQEFVIKSGQYYPKFMVSPSSQMITFETANGGIITLRTSGTEPKIKYYCEISGDNNDRESVAKELKQLVLSVGDDFLEAKANGLV